MRQIQLIEVESLDIEDFAEDIVGTLSSNDCINGETTLVLICESAELMVALGEQFVAEDITIYMDNPEANYECGSNKLIEKFVEENPNHIDTRELFNTSMYKDSVIIKGNTYAGCYYDNPNSTTVIARCRIDNKGKKLSMFYDSSEYLRAADTFCKQSDSTAKVVIFQQKLV